MLVIIALLCAAITAALTLYAAFADSKHGGQSIQDSMRESWVNIGIGFGINYVANLIVLPLAGLPVTAVGAFYIGVIFTAISVVRSFAVRRWFNARMVHTQSPKR
jgi:O-antigen/teichoic acid export membrane protein